MRSEGGQAAENMMAWHFEKCTVGAGSVPAHPVQYLENKVAGGPRASCWIQCGALEIPGLHWLLLVLRYTWEWGWWSMQLNGRSFGKL